MSDGIEFKPDASGNLTFLPLLRWGVSIVQGQTVGVLVEYYANASDERAGKTTRLQLHMASQAAREFASVLDARGEAIQKGRV